MKNIVFLMVSMLVLGSTAYATDTSYQALLKQLNPDIRNDMPAIPTPKAVKQVGIKNVDNSSRYYINVKAKTSQERTKLLENGMDITQVNKDSVSGFAYGDTINKIEENLKYEIRSVFDSESLEQRDFPSYDSAYHNYQETTEVLKALASKNPDIASIFSIGKTVEGRDIWGLRINTSAKGNAQSNKPGSFFLGNHHAREHMSNEVPLFLAAWLMENRNTDEVKAYINNLDIYIIPMLNPDGVEYDVKNGRYQTYRKNRVKNSDGSFGVDLNRNYDFLWCKYGSSHTPRYDTYCGSSAFSEQESQAIRNFFAAHKNIKTHISYHTYGALVLYPYGGTYDDVEDSRDSQAMSKIAKAMASYTGYTAQKSSDLYVSSGDSCDWAYKAHKVFAFTIELEGNDFYPPASEIEGVVGKNINAARYLLSVTANPYQ